MTPRSYVLVVLSSLTPLLAADGMAAAPPLQVRAEAARASVQVGEPVRITIHVKDSEELPQIDAPNVEGMRISSTGTAEVKPSILRNVRPLSTGHVPASKLVDSLRDLSKQLDSAPGAMPNLADPQLTKQYQGMLKQGLGNINRSDYAFVYLATPENVGPITVPAFTVHSGGQTVETKPIRLTVTEPRPSPWVKASLSLSNPKPFVGDTVNLYVDLLVRRWPQQIGRSKTNFKSQPINHVMLTVPPLDGYKEVQPLQPLEQFVEKRRLPPGQLGYHINQYPGVILLEQEPKSASANTSDPQWYRRRLTIPFRAASSGEMKLPPFRAAGEVYVPGGKEGYHWDGFVTSSEPLTIRILDVANRPSDYNGTIGSCRLIASASRSEMPAGTPFTLSLREEGQGNLAHATPPNLEALASFRDHFVIRPEKDVLRSEHVREFAWTLRPRSEAVAEVPAIPLSWFDPQSEKFERVRSAAIPLHVTPAPVRPAAPKVAADELASDEEPSAAAEAKTPAPSRSFARPAAFLATMATVVVLAGILIGGRRQRGTRRQRAARMRQQRQIIEQTRQRLQTPPLSANDVSLAMQDFLRARLEMSPGEITPDEAAEHLMQAGFPMELAERCAEVLRECATRQFAPGQTHASANDLALAADRLVSVILATRPTAPTASLSSVDELTRERQAALVD